MDNLFKLDSAIVAATLCADQCQLPQTVFKTADTCGWWHTNPYAKCLEKAEKFVSVLPARYFS